jgi:hypothetical protein
MIWMGHMEEFFKTKLLKRQNPPLNRSFSEVVYGDVDWAIPDSRSPRETAIPTSVSEKSIVIDSFTQFAHEKLAQSPVGKVVLDKVELSLKNPTPSSVWKPTFENLESWKSHWLSLQPEFLKGFYDKTRPDVVILCDEKKEGTDYKSENEFFFSDGVLELWLKMLQALKLAEEKKWTISVQTLSLSELKEALYWLQPKVVVTLGAVAVQALLETKERLASLHGKSTTLALSDKELTVVPLFHPSILVNNLSMKKTTWQDMQIILEKLTLI